MVHRPAKYAPGTVAAIPGGRMQLTRPGPVVQGSVIVPESLTTATGASTGHRPAQGPARARELPRPANDYTVSVAEKGSPGWGRHAPGQTGLLAVSLRVIEPSARVMVRASQLPPQALNTIVSVAWP
jgi:hypothetical protein